MSLTTQRVNLRHELSRLTIPIFFETLLIALMGGVDTFMLSQFSDNAVGAVGMVNQLITFVFLIFQITNLGTTVLCSQYIGAGKRGKMVQVTGVALLLNLVVGIVMSLALYATAGPLLETMGLRPEMMQYGLPYLEIVGSFVFFQALHMTVSASLRADRKAFYPMAVIFIVNIVNIIGNYALIFGHWGLPALGVVGAAMSTVISRGVAMLLLFVVLFTRHIPRFPLSSFRPFPWHELKRLLQIGIPSAGENLSYNSQQIVIMYFINMLGNAELSTFTYINNIVMFVYIFCISIAQSGAISIGHIIGERKPKAAYSMGRYIMRMAMVVTLLLSVASALGGKIIFGWLTDNPDIIALGTLILFVNIGREMGRTINIFATNVLRATGDVNFPFYVGVCLQWTAGVALGYLFGIIFHWGLVGMWLAFILDENIRGIIFVWRWRSMKWARKAFV